MENMVTIDVSPKQLSKLRNGHKVRIVKGSGYNLLVSPGNYSTITKGFSKNKGVNIALSEAEREANKGLTIEQLNALRSEFNTASKVGTLPMMGQGIFSKETAKSLAKSGAKAGIRVGAEMGAKALEDYNPVLGSVSRPIINKLKDIPIDYIDGEGLYASRSSGRGLRAGAGMYAGAGMGGMCGCMNGCRMCSRGMCGGAMNPMSITGSGRLLESMQPQALQSQSMDANFMERYMLPPTYSMLGSGMMERDMGMSGMGMYGCGMNGYASMIPALRSQPYNENFLSNNMLPVEFQYLRR
jgi:hypothetical protein